MRIFTRIKSNILVAKRKRRMKRQFDKFPLLCLVRGNKAQSLLAQSRTGDELQIVHTPTAEYPKTVFVYSIPLNGILGYLEFSVCEKLLFALGANFCVDGKIEELREENGAFYFTVRVFPTSKKMANLDDFSHLYGE